MALKGPFSDMSFSELIYWISLSGRKGTLLVRDGKIEKLITFGKKCLLAAASNMQWERLGSILLRKNIISIESLKKALIHSNNNKVRLARALVDLNILSSKELYYLLLMQAEIIIFDIFFWESGSFVFYNEIKAFEHLEDLAFSTDYFLLEGVKRLDEGIAIRDTFQSPFLTFKSNTLKVLEEPIDRLIVNAFEEGLSLIECMLYLPVSEFHALRECYKLFREGAIMIGTEKTLANFSNPRIILDYLNGGGFSLWRVESIKKAEVMPIRKATDIPDEIKRYQDYYANLAKEDIGENHLFFADALKKHKSTKEGLEGP